MNYIAVDDEPYALKDLEEELQRAAPNAVLHSFTLPGKALEYARSNPVDAAFLDIELSSANGLVLAKQLKDLQSRIQIIFVTSHEQYAVKAFELHATGYLMKPVTAEDIRRELTFLYKDSGRDKRVRVQTFGGFDVFVDGKPLEFKRSKSKELLAYLIDRHGANVTTGELCAALWEDGMGGAGQKSYLRTLLSDLRASLRRAGAGEILRKGFDSVAIVPELLDCDSYRFLEGDLQAVNSYRHDYLPAYSWAEFSVAALEERL